MFLGRPINLWNGLIGSGIGLAILVISATQPADVAQQWAIILGGAGTFLGVFVAFLAGQPPTLSPGDTFTVKTAGSAPNYTTVVAHPPAQDAAPVAQAADPPADDGGVG